MPNMKVLIRTLLSSIKELGGIMGLASFFFTIFAILGVSLWDGKIHYRCYETSVPDENGDWKVIEEIIDLCSEDVYDCKKGFCRSRFVQHAQWLAC